MRLTLLYILHTYYWEAGTHIMFICWINMYLVHIKKLILSFLWIQSLIDVGI